MWETCSLVEGIASVLMGTVIKGSHPQGHKRQITFKITEAWKFLMTGGAEGRYTEGDNS